MFLKTMKKILLLLAVTCFAHNASFAQQASEQVAQPTSEQEDALLLQRVDALLQQAVAHIEEKGADGAYDFAKEKRFIDRELYVYSLDINGNFISSGGDSAALTGSNVLSYNDPNGKEFFREIVEAAAKQSSGEIHYHWFSPGGDITPKTTRYQRVGDLIVAVGYHAPRATIEDARAMLDRALAAWRADASKATHDFAQLGEFLHDDLYVFVVNIDGKIIINGSEADAVGNDGLLIKDEGDNYFIAKMIEMATEEGKFYKIFYRWRNPLSEKIERKHTVFTREGDVIIAVGSYVREF